MELTLRILNELVVLPHWQIMVLVALAATGVFSALVACFFAIYRKAEANVKEQEIVFLYAENAKLRSQLSTL